MASARSPVGRDRLCTNGMALNDTPPTKKGGVATALSKTSLRNVDQAMTPAPQQSAVSADVVVASIRR
jgi:hypothetical protein